MPGRTFARVLVAVLMPALVVGLTACSTPVAAPASTPKQTTTHDPAQSIGRTIDPVGTTWSGTDSAGDLSTFTLKSDHGLKVGYGSHVFDQQGDTWSVTDGALALHVYIDAANGYLDYTSVWDAANKTLSATGTTTLSKRTVTVTLAQK